MVIQTIDPGVSHVKATVERNPGWNIACVEKSDVSKVIQGDFASVHYMLFCDMRGPSDDQVACNWMANPLWR